MKITPEQLGVSVDGLLLSSELTYSVGALEAYGIITTEDAQQFADKISQKCLGMTLLEFQNRAYGVLTSA